MPIHRVTMHPKTTEKRLYAASADGHWVQDGFVNLVVELVPIATEHWAAIRMTIAHVAIESVTDTTSFIHWCLSSQIIKLVNALNAPTTTFVYRLFTYFSPSYYFIVCSYSVFHYYFLFSVDSYSKSIIPLPWHWLYMFHLTEYRLVSNENPNILIESENARVLLLYLHRLSIILQLQFFVASDHSLYFFRLVNALGCGVSYIAKVSCLPAVLDAVNYRTFLRFHRII